MNARTMGSVHRWATWSLLLLGLCFAPLALAKTVYIRDQLYVPLRSGEGENFRIVHKGIQSGTAMELLESNSESGYSRIRMADGVEGWIQSQYLVDDPIARDRLGELRERYSGLERELTSARQQTAATEKRLRAMEGEKEQLEERNQEVAAELSRITRLATDSVELDEQNRALTERNRALSEELDGLTALNMELESRRQQEWFWLGGGTVLISLLLGIWIGRKLYFGRTRGSWS